MGVMSLCMNDITPIIFYSYCQLPIAARHYGQHIGGAEVGAGQGL